MDAVTSYGVEFPVSVWMKRVGIPPTVTSTSGDNPGPMISRVIVIVEPVERSSAHFTVDQNGNYTLMLSLTVLHAFGQQYYNEY